MEYIALKPIMLGGSQHVKGDTIPGNVIDPGRVKTLTRQRYIVGVDVTAPPPPVIEDKTPIAIPNLDNGQPEETEVEYRKLHTVLLVLQLPQEKAEDEINATNDHEVLQLLYRLDHRQDITDLLKQKLGIPDDDNSAENQQAPVVPVAAAAPISAVAAVPEPEPEPKKPRGRRKQTEGVNPDGGNIHL